MITFRQLEIFVAVVRHGSFRRGADHLGVSQVVASEHIKALEDRLGTLLFERRPGGPAVLTEAGRNAEARATAILAEVGDFVQAIAGDKSKRRIHVALQPFMMRNLRDALAAFSEDHRSIDLQIDLDTEDVDSLVDRVNQRELDLAYFFTNETDAASHGTFVRNEELAIFVGADHPLAKQAPISPEKLKHVPAIHLPPRRPLRRMIDRALDALGASNGQIGLETDDFGLILSSVHRNQGFVCMFRAAEEEMAQTWGLTRVLIDAELPKLQIRVAARPSAKHDPMLCELRTVID